MKFTKMHGCGNDYVYVNCFAEIVENPSDVALKVSDRHFGIGSDGLILIKPSDKADFFMEMYNSDGSQAEMCGNGIRCVAKYVYDYGLTDKKEISVDTLAGIKYLKLETEKGKVKNVIVDMGTPLLKPTEVPVLFDGESCIDKPVSVAGKEYRISCVSMGNPHAVVYMDDIESLDIETIGPLFENHEKFPKRTNTEFIQLVNRSHIKMRVWERGAGETLACGTGACASVVASVLNGYTENRVEVELLGGTLVVEYDRENDKVYMTGPATVVFDGEIDLSEIKKSNE